MKKRHICAFASTSAVPGPRRARVKAVSRPPGQTWPAPVRVGKGARAVRVDGDEALPACEVVHAGVVPLACRVRTSAVEVEHYRQWLALSSLRRNRDDVAAVAPVVPQGDLVRAGWKWCEADDGGDERGEHLASHRVAEVLAGDEPPVRESGVVPEASRGLS